MRQMALISSWASWSMQNAKLCKESESASCKMTYDTTLSLPESVGQKHLTQKLLAILVVTASAALANAETH